MSLRAEDEYESEFYPAEVEKMDSDISGVVLLETFAAVFLLPNLVIGIEFFLIIGILNPLSHFVSILYMGLLGFLFVITLLIAWAFWTVQPWARRYGIYVSIISVFVSPLSSNMVVNIILIIILRGSNMKSLFP